ncbi:selection/upkeep of intraepithelial T-cells protein [Parasponia andersonii]|uniref:Selection/upkeep of intraepithelial T-cells protein n=1 Tax=Parasponia andersonii TaxID=3476 RepID=A0A2P5BMF1_PARAD|nr:selection/upkeep of intraepithelial T-cells protein [Parasponia andersonii]
MANQPVRSISLPSREHPCSVRIEALLNHLKAYQFSSSVPFEFETIQTSLVALAELYNCLEELIGSPSTQQALLSTIHGKLVEQALEGSITLLDTCNMARDLLLTTKEHVQTLQSALRRKGGDSTFETDIHSYLCFRKKAKKDIAKCLGGLKRIETKVIASQALDLGHDLSMVERTLRETSSITVYIFRFLLKFMAMPAPSAKASGWSLISKLMRVKLLSSEKEEKMVNLVGCVDVCLHSLMGNIQTNESRAQLKMTQRMLETLNSSSEGLMTGLDCMFRCLVQNRVSLLNILTL